MKKSFLLVVINCLLVFGVSSQTRARYIDNFDMGSGVKVVVSSDVITPGPTKKLVKKTVQRNVNVQNAVGLKIGLPLGTSLNKLSMSAGTSMKGFTTGDNIIDSYIVDSAIKHGIDPLLIYSQMHQESSFKIRATSYKGASGLMQLMPATARRFGVTEIYNPKQNIEAGIKYMRWLIDTFNGDVNLALAGYNAGEGAVMKYGWQIPPYRETQEYVRRISTRYNSIRNPGLMTKAVKRVSATEVAKLEKKESAPLSVYEVAPLTVRMPDGRMRLVNQ